MNNPNPYAAATTTHNPVGPPVAAGPMWFMQPLFASATQLKILGWCLIALGVMYCLTVVGIIFGWVPIWMGICFKSAGEQFDLANQTQNPSAAREGSQQIRTAILIMFYCMIVSVIFMALYFLAIIAFLLIGLIAAAGSAGA